MKQRGFTLIELLVVIAIIAILAAILFPVFAKARQAALASTCQSNMKQIGVAMNMYTQDYEETYPTNQLSITSPAASPAIQAFLTRPGVAPVMLTYVESLEKSIQKSGGKNSASVWKCPAGSDKFTPWDNGNGNYDDSRVCYAVNYNILEATEGTAKSPASTMMFRELGLRGQSYTAAYPQGSGKPARIFLADGDTWGIFTNPAQKPNQKPHGEASHILFMDGHVEKVQNDLAKTANVIHPTERPSAWACCEGGDASKPKIWITP